MEVRPRSNVPLDIPISKLRTMRFVHSVAQPPTHPSDPNAITMPSYELVLQTESFRTNRDVVQILDVADHGSLSRRRGHFYQAFACANPANTAHPADCLERSTR